MRAVVVLSMLVLASATYHYDLDAPLESDIIIEAVNKAQTTWTAGRNFDKSYTKQHVKHLMGLKKPLEGNQLPPLLDDEDDEDIELPDSFDAREKWSYCISLQEVRDQGVCGSCWAVSAAATLTDRFCIATEGKFNGHLSAQDLMSCDILANGCSGGDEYSAWNYMKQNGICTGGDYQSDEGCQPYTVPACEHLVVGPRKNCSEFPHPYPTPECQDSCYNKKYKFRSKYQDLYKAKTVFSIHRDVKKIQKQIFKYGPVQADYSVYEDFVSYKKGVYQYITGRRLDGHAVKVIGWGTENGVDYWLVANSWNSDWAGLNGFFKIRRGTNECGFENNILAGYPDV